MNSVSSSNEISINPETKLRHICEGCGKEEVLTPDEAYQAGWDYPPGIGAFGVVSPRTCPECGVDQTLYWRIIRNEVKTLQDLSEKEMELLTRIQNEPDSILAESG